MSPLTRDRVVRAMWTLVEPLHSLNYFSDEARAAFADVGLTRFWDGYFAGRAAPLGAVEAAPVVAIFSGFSPALTGRALPAAWSVASPSRVLEARAAGAEAALRRIFGAPGVDIPAADVARAAEVLVPVAERAAGDTIGRPLAAANAALPVPPADEPYRRLWQATSTIREHRGDGHVVALVSEGIAGLSTIILRSGLDLAPKTMKAARGWTDEQWAAEASALVGRGLLDADGRITPSGSAAVDRAEALTNRLALSPWKGLSDDDLLEVARVLRPLSAACGAIYPYPNPIGMPQPWDPDADPALAGVPEVPGTRIPASSPSF